VSVGDGHGVDPRDLADLFGVSKVLVQPGLEGIKVEDAKAPPYAFKKCERSWRYDETVRARAGGVVLSDRDAEAEGVAG
jgi:hypothetical protein